MAILDQGALGRFGGKVGKVVIYQMHGKLVMRSLPGKRKAKAKGRQKATQDLFALVMNAMKIARAFIRTGFANYNGHSAFHSALSCNMQRVNAAGSFGYSTLLFSSGNLAVVINPTITISDTKQIQIGWLENEAGKPAADSDCAMVLAFNTKRNFTEAEFNAGTRGAQKAGITLSQSVSGDQLEVYLAFIEWDKRLSGKKYRCSDSLWVGQLTVL